MYEILPFLGLGVFGFLGIDAIAVDFGSFEVETAGVPVRDVGRFILPSRFVSVPSFRGFSAFFASLRGMVGESEISWRYASLSCRIHLAALKLTSAPVSCLTASSVGLSGCPNVFLSLCNDLGNVECCFCFHTSGFRQF